MKYLTVRAAGYTVYFQGLIKNLGLKFLESYKQRQKISEEGQRAWKAKRFEYNNQDQDNNQKKTKIVLIQSYIAIFLSFYHKILKNIFYAMVDVHSFIFIVTLTLAKCISFLFILLWEFWTTLIHKCGSVPQGE